MAQNQYCKILWRFGTNTDQDVSIRLVTDTNNQRVTSLHSSSGVLAELKVHSNQLKNCSKYFEAYMSARWTVTYPNTSSTSSMEFTLEMIPGLEVACYVDCFSRMYTPFRKDFKDVKSSLELLRVASQIEFLELISSICRYLADIKWSNEDELRIRQYSSSPDFSRSQANGLVARLALDTPSKEDDCRVECNLMEKVIRIALRREKDNDFHQRLMTFDDARLFLEEVFANIELSDASTFEEDMIMIVSNVAKGMLLEFDEECRHQATIHSKSSNVSSIGNAPGFGLELEAICWILKKLLKAHVAQEVVQCFIHLKMQSMILESAISSSSLHKNACAIEFAGLVLFIHREVVAGNLVLGIPEKILLLENWDLISAYQKLSKKYDLLYDMGFEQARDDEVVFLSSEKQVKLLSQAWEGVFFTLPSQQQREILQRRKSKYRIYRRR